MFKVLQKLKSLSPSRIPHLKSRNPHKRNHFHKNLEGEINILNPLNKNLSEADTGGGSYITSFMSSEFLRTFKNS